MASHWIRETVHEFGQQAGIADLRLSPAGTLHLKLDSGDQIILESLTDPVSDMVLLYLVRPVGHELGRLMRSALGRAHHQEVGLYGLMVACQGSGPEAVLVAGIRQAEQGFTAQGLTHAIEFLGRWMDKVQGGSRA